MREGREACEERETQAELEEREKREMCVSEWLRGVLIDYSLDVGNRVLFDRMTGADWLSELTGGEEMELTTMTYDVNNDIGDLWGTQLLKAFLGEKENLTEEEVSSIYDAYN